MQRDKAEKITAEFLKDIYGFSLKRCANLQDAEDLTQDIALRIFGALLKKDDIYSVEKFVWTVAHNTLANYYRGKNRTASSISIDVLAEVLASEDESACDIEEKESIERLHAEIAYLSAIQRRIVISYYFENKKQEEIANFLSLPVGTVKWHLFEAKKELKRGMNTMRQHGELKFNPVCFELCGTNGSPGTKGANNNFFTSALPENIVYDVRKQAKTVNEIADDLGVSPVYIESEAEYLAKYGFLVENKGKYISNILLSEADDALVSLHDEMYSKAAGIFAPELYNELTQSGILNDPRIVCGSGEKNIELKIDGKADDNFLLWSLIPYIAALSGEELMDKSISFEEAATLRPDGGHNICQASVIQPGVKQPKYFESMKHWCGPCWNRNDEFILWQIDSQWSAARVDDGYLEKAKRILDLFSKMQHSDLTEEESAFLVQMGIIKTNGNYHGMLKESIQAVWLTNAEIRTELLGMGDKIKKKHWDTFCKIKEPFEKAVIARTPKHLWKTRKYVLQFIFFSDGWFILHCLKELINSGKLKLPANNQKMSLTTLITPA